MQDPTRTSHVESQFAAALSEAFRDAATAAHGNAWESEVDLSRSAEATPGANALTVALRLGGTLAGELFLSIDQADAEVLLAERGCASCNNPRSGLLPGFPKRSARS